MKNPKSPCGKDCEKRKVGCRKECEAWQKYEKEYKEFERLRTTEWTVYNGYKYKH